MTEYQIERSVYDWCKKKDLICWKLLSPPRGVPDRMVLGPGGKILFLEFKQPGGKLSIHQRIIHKTLRGMGFQVMTVYDREGAIAFIEEHMFLGGD